MLAWYRGASRSALWVTCVTTGALPDSASIPEMDGISSSSSSFVHIVLPPHLVGDPGVRDPFRGSPSESSSSGSKVPLTSSCRYGAFVGVTSDIVTVDSDELVATGLPRRRGRLWPHGLSLSNCRPTSSYWQILS